MAWYGKAFYFVELPRRFILTILAVAVFRRFLPEEWMRWALFAVCFLFDLLIVSRAPDIRINKEEVQAKLALGAQPVFLTWREVKRRCGVLGLGAALCLAIAGYWFTNDQQPSPVSQFVVSATILLEVAYLSALGIPLRTKRELKEGDKPFVLLPFLSSEHRAGMLIPLGIPWFMLWVFMFLLYFSIADLNLADGTVPWKGSFSSFVFFFMVPLTFIFLTVVSAALLILTLKMRYFTHPKKH